MIVKELKALIASIDTEYDEFDIVIPEEEYLAEIESIATIALPNHKNRFSTKNYVELDLIRK